MFLSKTLLQMGIFDFSQKETGAKSVTMAKTVKVSFVMHISGANFEEHCSNISRDTCILDSAFYCSSGMISDIITFLICKIQKRRYL